MQHRAGLIVALDTADAAEANAWARELAPYAAAFKLGLEFFAANGPQAVARFGRKVFLDLKFHDIPTTVAKAVRAVLPLRPKMLSLHAAGGRAMIEAARLAVEAYGEERPLLLAVTVLTSLSPAGLAEIGIPDGPEQQVLRLARLALSAGADGLICSPQEVALLRAEFGAGPVLVVPGIRPGGSQLMDQARTLSPVPPLPRARIFSSWAGRLRLPKTRLRPQNIFLLKWLPRDQGQNMRHQQRGRV